MRPVRAAALGLVVASLLALPSAARAQEGAPPAKPADAKPVEVTLGFHVFDVRDVDLKAQRFYADFYMWMRFTAPVGDAKAAAEIEKFEFMNGKTDSREEQDRKVTKDGVTYICWRMSGTFGFDAKLQNYPFDAQNLEIVVEHPSLEVDRVVYADDSSSYRRSSAPREVWGVRDGLKIPEFTLRSTDHATTQSVYNTDFGDPERAAPKSVYSRFVYTMRFHRDFMPYFFKIVIPLTVIMAMAYLVFFLPAKEIQTASALAITGLLSCIAFNITVAQNLPEVGYLVLSDKFFLCTYVLLFLTLLQSVLKYTATDRGKNVEHWNKPARFIFPLLYVATFADQLLHVLKGS
jgi:hypothetical protein